MVKGSLYEPIARLCFYQAHAASCMLQLPSSLGSDDVTYLLAFRCGVGHRVGIPESESCQSCYRPSLSGIALLGGVSKHWKIPDNNRHLVLAPASPLRTLYSATIFCFSADGVHHCWCVLTISRVRAGSRMRSAIRSLLKDAEPGKIACRAVFDEQTLMNVTCTQRSIYTEPVKAKLQTQTLFAMV